MLLGASNVFSIDFSSQEDRMSAYITRDPTDVADFIAGKDVHQELANRLEISSRDVAKRIRHATRYGMKVNSLSKTLGIPYSEAERLYDTYRIKYERTFFFATSLRVQDEFYTPVLGRQIKMSTYKEHTKFNWVVQGSCSDLLLKALNYVLESKEVELRSHFHDSLYLACLCKGPHPGCEQSKKVVEEIENLYWFKWPGTKERVFKFGEIEWKGG